MIYEVSTASDRGVYCQMPLTYQEGRSRIPFCRPCSLGFRLRSKVEQFRLNEISCYHSVVWKFFRFDLKNQQTVTGLTFRRLWT